MSIVRDQFRIIRASQFLFEIKTKMQARRIKSLQKNINNIPAYLRSAQVINEAEKNRLDKVEGYIDALNERRNEAITQRFHLQA